MTIASGSACSRSSASWPGRARCALELADGADVEDAWAALVARLPGPRARAGRRSASPGTATTPTPTTVLADGDEVAMIPPVVGRSSTGRRPDPRAPRRRRSRPGSSARARPTGWPTPADGAVVGFLGRTRGDARDAGAGPGGRGRPARRAGASRRSSTRPTSRWPLAHPRRRSPTRSRRGSASTGWPSSIGPARCRSARRRIAVVAAAPHRDAAFEAARYAIDETKARAPIWKAERFADGHVWIGHPARTGPEEDGS